MSEPRRRFSVRLGPLGMTLLAYVVAFAIWKGYVWGRTAPVQTAVQSATEMQVFRERYGPGHYTEREEEWMIRDYFQDRR